NDGRGRRAGPAHGVAALAAPAAHRARGRSRGAGRPGRRPGRLAVRDPHGRHDGNGAGAGAVDRRGRDLRAAAARGGALPFARPLPGGMFYGSRGVFLLSAGTARGSRQAPGYLLAKLPPFVRPFYWYDLYRPEQAQYSAIDRNHILWRVTAEGDRARFRDDTVAVHDYRFLFGFDSTSGTLRWAYTHPSDAVGSTDT